MNHAAPHPARYRHQAGPALISPCSLDTCWRRLVRLGCPAGPTGWVVGVKAGLGQSGGAQRDDLKHLVEERVCLTNQSLCTARRRRVSSPQRTEKAFGVFGKYISLGDTPVLMDILVKWEAGDLPTLSR